MIRALFEAPFDRDPRGARPSSGIARFEIPRTAATGCGRIRSGFFGMPGSKQESMPTLYDGPVDEFDGEKAEAEQERIGSIKNDFIEAQKKA